MTPREYLVIFESDIDRPVWFVLEEKFPSWAIQKAWRRLRARLGPERSCNYQVSKVARR